MRVIRLILLALLLAPAFAAHADYSWELAGLFDHTNRSPDLNRTPTDELHSHLVSVSATHYFDPVTDGSGPLALAAFFDPRTNLAVAAGEENITDKSYGGPNSFVDVVGKEDVSDYSLSGVYLFPESKWYAGGRYELHDGDRRFSSTSVRGSASGTDSSDLRDYALFAGKYFGKGTTRLELSLGQSTEEDTLSSTSCDRSGVCSAPQQFSGEDTWDTLELAVMHVRRFRSATYALLGDVSEQRFRRAGVESPWTYFVGAELYPVSTIGVRVGYERVETSFDEHNTVSIGASWFFRRNVGLDLRLSRNRDIQRFFFQEDSRSTDGVTLRVIGRL
jgi:hypothetical protein